MEKYIFYAGIGMITVALAMLVAMRRYLVKYTTSLISCLDEMIAGKRDIDFDEEHELLMSKVQVKMRQLYEILQSRTDQSIRDREQLEATLSDISHQIKTPMANIRMYHEIIRKRDLKPQQAQLFLESVTEQVDKLEFLMNSMIEMSRMEVGMIRVQPVYQSVLPLVEQAVCAIALKAGEKQIDLTVDCEPYIKAVYDMKWTLEALVNILDNAVKYTPDQGKIRVQVSVTDFFTKFEVADNGTGIEEEHLPQIFRRFYREPKAAQVEGAGIGLYLAQEIIGLQKGFIDVRSEPGAGSAFSILLPADE